MLNISRENFFSVAERGLTALLLLGLAVWGGEKIYMHYTDANKKARHESLHDEAMKYHRLADTDKSIPLWEQALIYVSSPQERIHAQAALAWDNFITCQPEKKKKGVAMMKEMVADESIPGLTRAMILTSMLDMYNATHDDDFSHAVIFRGQPYETFLAEAGGHDTHIAARKLYEWSLALAPTANAHFRIAYWYGEQLTRSKLLEKELSPEVKTAYANQLITHLRKGEELMDRDITLIQKADSPTRIAALKIIHAMVVGFAALRNSEDTSLAHVDTLFRSILNDIDKESKEKADDLFLRDMVYEVRYDYVGFLVAGYGAEKREDIRELASVMGDALRAINGKTPLFTQLIMNEYTRSVRLAGVEDHVHFPDYHELLKVAEFVPEFKITLEKFGWKFVAAR